MNEQDERFAALSDYVKQQMADLHVPGVALGLLHGDTEEIAGFGVTNVENPLPVDGDTLFQIGSISKTVTGTVAMRLVEDGKLDLDTPVREYLPSLRLKDETVAARVTMRHLLAHTGGWVGDYFDDAGPGDDALALLVERMVDLDQLTPLGEIWSYNNAGFYAAGRVIEALAGKTYEETVQELIFAPLGMDRSFFFAADAITYRVAVGHHIVDGVAQVARPWALARAANPVGGIVATARDMLRYARFWLGDGTTAQGERLLSAASMDLMREPIISTGRDEWVGLTWYLRDAGDKRLVAHGGATNAQLAYFVTAPTADFAVVVLTNASSGGELHHFVSDRALQLYLGIAPQTPERQEHSANQLAEYVGRYSSRMASYELRLEDGALIMQATAKGGFPKKDSPPPPESPPPVPLTFYDQDKVIILEPPFSGARGDFLRDSAGRVAWLRMGGRVARREE